MRRRDFVLSSAGLGLYSALFGLPAATAAPTRINRERFDRTPLERPSRRLSVLFLGGTGFLGAPTVHRLLARGHAVTLFNRGKTNPGLFPEAENLQGNRFPARDGGLKALGGDRRWDVVIDTWRENPMVVDASIELLSERVGRYIYVSSIAVYGNDNYETVSPITEETPLPSVDLPTGIEEETGYRASKILADASVLEKLGDRGVTLRPHGIYGFYMSDDSDGQAYWPVRIDRGGDVLCPGDGLDGIQFVDVLDVADFIALAAEKGLSGPFNVCNRLTFREFLENLQALAANASRLHWVDRETLSGAGIRPYSNLPLWVPRDLGPGFHNISAERAETAGLQYRKFEKTFTDVIDGFYARKGRHFQFPEPIVSDEQARQVLAGLDLV